MIGIQTRRAAKSIQPIINPDFHVKMQRPEPGVSIASAMFWVIMPVFVRLHVETSEYKLQ